MISSWLDDIRTLFPKGSHSQVPGVRTSLAGWVAGLCPSLPVLGEGMLSLTRPASPAPGVSVCQFPALVQLRSWGGRSLEGTMLWPGPRQQPQSSPRVPSCTTSTEWPHGPSLSACKWSSGPILSSVAVLLAACWADKETRQLVTAHATLAHPSFRCSQHSDGHGLGGWCSPASWTRRRLTGCSLSAGF